MILNHDRSSALHAWGVICTILGVILLLLGVFFLVFEWEGVGSVLLTGIGLLVFAPILKGLSVIVEDAEDRLIPKYKKILEEKKSAGPSE
jgi:multisubunit Na+/H+ antiporter MnhG subunit